jgi:hypothetical protein
MKENIPKILGRVKGQELVIAKERLFKMVLTLDNLHAIGDYVVVDVILKEYVLIIEEGVLIDGFEYCNDSIVNIHNEAIRREIRSLLKHYGIEMFSYDLKRFTSSNHLVSGPEDLS